MREREREREELTWRKRERRIDVGERERESEELTWKRERENGERGIDLNLILVTETSFYLHEVNECNFVK